MEKIYFWYILYVLSVTSLIEQITRAYIFQPAIVYPTQVVANASKKS